MNIEYSTLGKIMPTQRSEDVTYEAMTWLDLADEDYVAARVLILNDFLIHGAMLSNTAIEKYLNKEEAGAALISI